MSTLLVLLIVVPVLGAVACRLASERTAYLAALATAVIELILVLPLIGPVFGGGERDAVAWAPEALRVTGFDVGVRLGLDATSFWLVLLTAGLMPLAVMGSLNGILHRRRAYYAWLTLLTAPMMGTFLARDAMLFYVFFELTLVPMFFLIGIWGGDERRFAAVKFFLFTFVGGVFTLAGLLYLGIVAGSFEFAAMIEAGQAIGDPRLKVVLFFALLAGFAVKVPLFPVHTWLPLAHTVAPTAGSVILAGVLLKLGTYGILKVAMPMGLLSSAAVAGPDGLLPVMRDSVIPLLAVLCIVGIIYGALIAWVQQDVKKLVAYSSVSHLGFCVLGLVALNTAGVQGSIFYMINHGISTGALFLMIGMLYDRYHTRMFVDYGGLGKVMPVFSFFLVLFTMSSIGLPGTNGFVSEFLTIMGAFTSPFLGPWYGAFAALGVILGAVYMLHMVARLIFGPLKLPGGDPGVHGSTAHGHAAAGGGAVPGLDPASTDHGSASTDHGPALPRDLSRREIGILVPLALAVVVLGVLPSPLLRSVRPEAMQAHVPADRLIVTRPALAAAD